MFKAFYWMFQTKDLCGTFFRRSAVILFTALIIAVTFCISCYSIFSNTSVFFGNIGLLISVFSALLLTFFIMGHYWELTASIIERKTDVHSSTVYGGKVSLVEYIKFPEIKIFRFCWRGFASSIAMFVMELPVILLTISIILFYNSSYLYIVIIVQLLIAFLSLGLFWNYAKNNSIFSMLNFYVAGYLVEGYPLKYIWNFILNILNTVLYYAIIFGLTILFHISSKQDFSSYYDCFRFAGYELALILPFIYLLHVQAYLVGTLSPKDDY